MYRDNESYKTISSPVVNVISGAQITSLQLDFKKQYKK